MLLLPVVFHMTGVAKWSQCDNKTVLSEGHGLRHPHFNGI